LPAVLARAQEGLQPLRCNHAYIYARPDGPAGHAEKLQPQQKTGGLGLPFKEDFSYSPTNNYPRQDLWMDSLVYISSGLGIAPPSIGVAAFDGLNKHGYPNEPDLVNLSASKPCDTLTSRPINLHTVGTQTLLPNHAVGLSFYYQPGGNGAVPQSNDSIILDLYKPIQQKWMSRVWFKKGNTTIDSIFRRAFVWLTDTAYLHENFQFRFRNSATPAGNFDQWLIDYIYLDQNRDSLKDINDDITFSHIPTPILKNYSAMPYTQYIASEMASNNSVRIRNNNKTAVITMSYDHQVLDTHNVQLFKYNGGIDQLKPFDPSGYSLNYKHRNPPLGYTLNDMNDSTDLYIKHYLYRSNLAESDFFPENDTVIQYQRFRNYYAYDDGSAEQGYYVNGNSGRIALKFKLNVSDTLRAVRIYFDPTGLLSTAKNYQFTLYIWNDAGNGPGNTQLYKDTIMHPAYLSTGFKGVPEYKLTRPLPMNAGTYYIGIKQQVDKSLVIGFDRNYDFHKNLYFDSGLGKGWEASGFKGSLMVRPVFGPFVPVPVGIGENARGDNFTAYPNPAADELHISAWKLNGTEYALYSMHGALLMNAPVTETKTAVDTRPLSDGVYFLILKENGRPVAHKKIIIAR
jgi:hypothetical protein